MTSFDLDPRLERDSAFVLQLDLCQLRLSNDSRWPWFILVPEIKEMTEIFDLATEQQARLFAEISWVAGALKKATGATKINIGALGNIVRQLHVHVIARHEGDANWPGPVWGFGTATDWDEQQRTALIHRLTEFLP